MKTADTTRQQAGAIQAWFRAHVAALAGLPVEEVEPEADFDSFGLDSVQGVDMVTALEQWLDVDDDLPIDIIFDAASIADAADAVAAFLAGRTPAR